MSYFKSVSLNLFNCKILWTNQNAKIWDQKCYFRVFLTKNALFGYFFGKNLKKNYCEIWNQPLQFCLVAKYQEKTKMPKFETKNALLGIFDQECPVWVFLGENFKKRLVSYLKSAPSNLSNCKIWQKSKTA